MTRRERILSVYRGQTPDVVPFMLDLSHWFYHRNQRPWDLSQSYDKPEMDLISFHRQNGVGFYLPNLGTFYTTTYSPAISVEVRKEISNGSTRIVWRYTTPLGCIQRERIWEEVSYSWAIADWAVRTEQDLRILAYTLSQRSYEPRWDRYRAWVDAVGADGVVYVPAGYSAMGELLSYWMGIEKTMYACVDCPQLVHEVVDAINENNLKLIDLLATSPAEIILMGDNFSSEIQPPQFFGEWSAAYYREAIQRLHRAGKFVAVHIDGRLRGALQMIRATGADCADAVTPAPMGDLTPQECREEAGTDFILSGGVSPDLWLPNAPIGAFRDAVLRWLELRHASPRLIANAGDQVPPNADETRIRLMRDLVKKHGRY